MHNDRYAFFGASVTEQKNGYPIHFIKKNKCLHYNIFGYGSRHLNDAGICYIDDVLKSNPSYCFIDWFSTGYINNKNDENTVDKIKLYIDTIVYKMLYKQIICIFLFLPDNSDTNVDKTIIYKKIMDYLNKINIPYIDLSNKFNDHELKRVSYDGIHTTEYGSSIYADIITKQFIETIYSNYKIPDKYPLKTKYDMIKILEINKICNEIKFRGKGEIISIEQLIGPYTGLLKLNEQIINIWDRWCYYQRLCNKINIEIIDELHIKCIQDDFDRSTCKNNIVWSKDKYLKINKIFYIGELDVSNITLYII